MGKGEITSLQVQETERGLGPVECAKEREKSNKVCFVGAKGGRGGIERGPVLRIRIDKIRGNDIEYTPGVWRTHWRLFSCGRRTSTSSRL